MSDATRRATRPSPSRRADSRCSPGTPRAALLARIRTLVADGRGLGGVIEALTGAYGASLPPSRPSRSRSRG